MLFSYIYHLPVQVCYEQWHRDLLLIKRLDDDLSYASLCLCNLVLFRDFFIFFLFFVIFLIVRNVNRKSEMVLNL